MVHLRRSKKFFNKFTEIQKKVQESNDLTAVCLDYLQNLDLPKIPIQDTFYLRQLNVNVFCVHDFKSETATIFLYHDGTAKKGANEVVSFLFNFIDTLSKDIKNIYIFSDGCGGQAKNNIIVRSLLALVDTGRFDSIEENFPCAL